MVTKIGDGIYIPFLVLTLENGMGDNSGGWDHRVWARSSFLQRLARSWSVCFGAFCIRIYRGTVFAKMLDHVIRIPPASGYVAHVSSRESSGSRLLHGVGSRNPSILPTLRGPVLGSRDPTMLCRVQFTGA